MGTRHVQPSALSEPSAGREGGVRPLRLLAGVVGAGLAYWASAALPVPDAAAAEPARRALAITVLIATFWLNGALPLGAASLLPLALFPLFAVQPMASVARAYSDPILWMFFGGFVLARAIERFGLHRRLALPHRPLPGSHISRLARWPIRCP